MGADPDRRRGGVAAGGGLILALMSDVRIASRSASFTTVFLKRGLIANNTGKGISVLRFMLQ